MKVLITGANGMLGQDLSPILEDVGCFVIKTDINNLDITNFKQVESVISQTKPDIVFHCAAYTNVDKAEDDIETALLINETGVKNIAQVCKNNNIVLVYISTDYVFDGEKQEAYQPNDTTNPINNYGLSKLKGELAVQSICEKYYIVRTSWLYGYYGKNFVETMISLAEKPELKVVDDQIGCPTWTVELANGIVKILNEPFGIYHICGSGSTSWYGFAKEIFNQMNKKVNLMPTLTKDFKRPAKRPKNSIMNNNGICRDWKIALSDYLKFRNMED